MRVLYFDIDGTLLSDRRGTPKRQLAEGAFEAAVRSRSFDRLVCVGSVVDVLEVTRPPEELRILFGVCRGTFADKAWFRSKVSRIRVSRCRAEEVDRDHDWWFIDDLAEHYFRSVGLGEVFERELNRRILVPNPEGDGASILRWLDGIPAARCGG